MSVFRRKYRGRISRYYTVSFTHAGRRYRQSTKCVTEAAAKRYEREMIQRLENGEVLDTAKVRGGNLPDLIDTFCIHYLTDTLKRDEMYVYTAIKRLYRLADVCLWTTPRAISLMSFDKWRASKPLAGGRGAITGKKLGAKTLNQYLDIARRFCSWLCTQGYLSRNPLEHAEHARVLVNENFRRPLTEAELTALFGSVKADRALFYSFALYCPRLRRRALRGLVWGDLHLDVPKPWGELRSETTKSRKPERFPIPAFLAARLADTGKGQKRSAPVFAHVPTPAEVTDDLAGAGIETKTDAGKVDLHSFRMTAVMLLKSKGAGLEECQKVLGHKTVQTTIKHYNKAPDPTAVAAVDRLPDLMGG